MFEAQVAGLLQSLLADFFEPSSLSSEDLKVSLFGGTVELERLELKPGALEALGLPFEVIRGQISYLKLRANWRNLFNEPIKVELGDVFVLFRPIEWKQEGAEQRLISRKLCSVYQSLYLRSEGLEMDELKRNAQKTMMELRAEQVFCVWHLAAS